jgi:uncharacterized protein with ParB-like and HNH nuclease domain
MGKKAVKITRFQDIQRFTRSAGYAVDHELSYLRQGVGHYLEYGLDVNPDFQRGYVWTDEQKVRFMEYMLRGGQSGMDIYFNCPGWNGGEDAYVPGTEKLRDFVLVDGKQRLNAAMGFLLGEFRVFGSFFGEYTDNPRIVQGRFKFHINDLKTRAEVLQWYLDLNTGGTVHTDDEIEKVKAMLTKEKKA